MNIYVQYILTGFGFIAIISYGYGQLVSGRNKSRLDTIAILEKDVGVLREEVTKLSDKVNELTKIIEEKDKKLGEALSILQGRNPEMEQFIKLATGYVNSSQPFLDQVKTDILPVVKKLDLYLNKQTF